MNKNSVILACLLVVLGTGFGAFAAQAQNHQGDIIGGVNVGYGFEIEEPSLGINGYYWITDEIRAGGDIIFFLVDSDNLSVWELNINGHYIFHEENDLRLYGLAGINYITFSYDFDDDAIFQQSSFTETGLNIGGGIEYNAGGLFLFAEPKFTISDADQLSINAGVRFGF